jgi:hypothetical protein
MTARLTSLLGRDDSVCCGCKSGYVGSGEPYFNSTKQWHNKCIGSSQPESSALWVIRLFFGISVIFRRSNSIGLALRALRPSEASNATAAGRY